MSEIKKYIKEINSFILDNSDLLTIVTKYNYNIIKILSDTYKPKIVSETEVEKEILKSLTSDIITIKKFVDDLLSNKLKDYESTKLILITEYDERLIYIKMFISAITKYKTEGIKLPKIILLSHNEKYTLGKNIIKLNFHNFESKKQTINIADIVTRVDRLKESFKNIVIFVDNARSYVNKFRNMNKINIVSSPDHKILDNITNLFILDWNTKYLIRNTHITYIIDTLYEKNKGEFVYTSKIISEERMNNHSDFINIIDVGIHYLNESIPIFFEKEEKDEKYNTNITYYIRKLISHNYNPTNKELFGEESIKYINMMNKMKISLYETNDYYNHDISLISGYLLNKMKHTKNLLILISILENDIKYIIKNKDVFKSGVKEITDLGDNVNDLELLITVIKNKINNNISSKLAEYFKNAELEKIETTYYSIASNLNIRVYDDMDNLTEFINNVRDIIIPYCKIVELIEQDVYIDEQNNIYKLSNNIIISKYKKQPRFLLILREFKNIIQLSIDIEDYKPLHTTDKFMMGVISQLNKDKLKESLNVFWQLNETDEKDILKLSQEDRYRFLETKIILYILNLYKEKKLKNLTYL